MIRFIFEIANISNLPLLLTGFVGPIVYIIFGSTKVVTMGPNAIQCILIYKFSHGKPPEYAVFFCFTTGVISLLMAIFRLGKIVKSCYVNYFIFEYFSELLNFLQDLLRTLSLIQLSVHSQGKLLTIVATQVKVHAHANWSFF